MQREAGCNTRSRLEGGCLCGYRCNQLFGHGPSLAESNHVGQLLQQHLVHCVGHVNAVLSGAPRQALCGTTGFVESDAQLATCAGCKHAGR